MEYSRISVPHHRSHRRSHREGKQSLARRGDDSSSKQLWPNLLAGADSNKENLVQGWLNKIGVWKQESLDETTRHLEYNNNASDYHIQPHIPHRSPGPWMTHDQPFRAAAKNTTPKRQKRKRDKYYQADFDDDSIIVLSDGDGYDQVPNLGDISGDRRSASVVEVGYDNRDKTRHQLDISDSLLSIPSSPMNHHFEKRARYRTRSDRYNVIKNDDSGREKKRTKQPKSKEGPKKNRKPNYTTSAREVMDNFKSKSILNDRITMQPSLGPGLFDNGRESKKQPIADLTFHNMAFLQQPRRETKKPLSRRRESEKKRDNREREEISAFFLHKNLPDRVDAKGRKQPAASGLSTTDEATCDNSSHKHARRQWSPDVVMDNDPTIVQEQAVRREREGSKATSYLTTSHTSPDHEIYPKCRSIERQDSADVRSPTPVYIRKALARTGIFNNTGIHYMQGLVPEGQGTRTQSRSDLNKFKTPSLPPPITQVVQTTQDVPVRIIRYQDRGTMAIEEPTCPHSQDDCTRSTFVQAPVPDVQDVGHNASKIPSIEPTVACTTLASKTSTKQPLQIQDTYDRAAAKSVAGKSTTVNKNSESQDAGPELGPSLKQAVNEPLEVSVNKTGLQGSATPTSRMSHSVQQDTHITSYAYKLHEPVRMAYQDASRDVGYTGSMAPSKSSISCSTCEMASAMASPLPGSIASKSPLASDTSLHKVLQNSAATGHSCGNWNSCSIQPESMLLRDDPRPIQDAKDHKSMKDFIAQLEREVLDRGHEDNEDEVTGPTSGWYMQGGYDGDLSGNCSEGRLDVHRQDGVQPRLGMNGMLVHRAPSNVSDYSWAQVGYFDGTDTDTEEQKFMSSFWRPNRYQN